MTAFCLMRTYLNTNHIILRIVIVFCIMSWNLTKAEAQHSKSSFDFLLKKCAYWEYRNSDSLKVYTAKMAEIATEESDQIAYQVYFNARTSTTKETFLDQINDAINRAKKVRNKCLEINATYTFAMVHLARKSHFDSALSILKILKPETRENADCIWEPSLLEGYILYSMARLYLYKGNYALAAKSASKMLEIAKRDSFQTVESYAYQILGAGYGYLSDTSNVLLSKEEAEQNFSFSQEYLRQGAVLSHKLGKLSSAAANYGNLAELLQSRPGKSDSVIYYLDKAIALNKKTGNVRLLQTNYMTMSQVYFSLADFEKSLDFGEEAYRLAFEVNQKKTIADASFNLYRIRNESQPNRVQLSNLYEALRIAEEIDYGDVILKANRALFEEALKKTDSSNALKYYLKYRVELDSNFRKEQYADIQELKTYYETEKKEQQISNLEQEALIADLQIKQQRFLLLASTFLLLIGLTTGYAFYRNRNLKAEKRRLVVEQRLLRSQMNPHFLFNALSSVHGYIYEGDKKQAAEYLSMFSELTRDILVYSAKELILLDEELATLKKYVQLQQLRFPHINYLMDLSEEVDAESLLIPPLILQPFVENAVEHGFGNASGGTITVTVEQAQQHLHVTIQDDGVGLGEKSASNEQMHAVKITEERIRLLAGMKKLPEVLRLEDRQKRGEKGVLVTLILPILEAV